MRIVNVRFLVVSGLLLALLGVGANLLHGIQVRRSSGILLELGTHKIEEGRPGDALTYLSRYTILAPHNAHAQITLADTLAGMGHAAEAKKWYEQALLRDAGQHEARRRLVELAIANRNFPSAKSHLVKFLLPYTPEDPRVYYLLALCHEALGEHEEAIRRLQETFKRDSTQVEAYAMLATLLREQRKSADEADAVMAELISKNPKNASAFIARADYRVKYRIEGVADDVRKAVQLEAQDVDILFRAARVSQELSQGSNQREELLREAEQYLQRGLEVEPRYPGWYLGFAELERRRGNIDKAIAHIELGLSASPNNADLQWNLADLLIQQERFDEALSIVERLGDQGFAKVPLEYLVAAADARRMRFVKAAERFRKIRGQMADWPELALQTEYWLGICYERLGEYGLQLTAFRNAAKLDPAWIPARQWLANALARTGRIDEAINEYDELTKLTGVAPEVYRDLGKLLVLRELQAPPQRRNWQRVSQFLSEASNIDPGADDYVILKAEMDAAQQNRSEARATLEKGLELYPKSAAIRLALAAVDQQMEQWDSAEKLLADAQHITGDTVDTRVARLRYVVQRYGLAAYSMLRELEQEELDRPVAEKQYWLNSLAAAYYTLGKYQDAGRIWRKSVDQEPDNILLRMFLFDLALADGNDARLQELLSEIDRIERADDRPLWRYGEATRLIVKARKGDLSVLARAEGLLEEVRAARQTWSRIPLLQAEIDELRGKGDEVVQHYLSAIELGERSPTIIRRVVELLYRQRRYAEADNVLRRFEATQLPITGELGRLAADVSFRVQDFSRAMQIAAQAIGDSEKYEDLVWMGQLHSVLNQSELAEEKFRRAVEMQPKLPNAWIALVQHFVRTANTAKARLAIAALTEKVEHESVAFVEAVCLEALNDLPAALRKFDEATASPQADFVVLRVAANFFLSHGLPAKGEPLLRRIIDKEGSSADDLEWARRNLAVVWAAIGDDNAKKKAIALIEENLGAHPTSADDRRAKALCLEATLQRSDSETALTIVRDLIRTGQSKPADYLTAYRLCMRIGERAEARRFLEQHTFENSSDPQNIARYIQFVLGNDELHEARLWVKRLKHLCASQSLEPGQEEQQIAQYHRFHVAADHLECEILVREHGPDAVIAYLNERVKASAPSPISQLSALESAQILEQLSQQGSTASGEYSTELRREAETAYQRAAGLSARDAVQLVKFLAQNGRAAEAFDSWNKYYDDSEADAFGLCAAALAATEHLGDRELKIMIKRLSTLPPKQQTKIVLSALSQLFSYQGQHEKAIAALRKALADDPNDVATMNNLACYLSLSGGDNQESLKLINTAIQLAGPSPALLDTRGMILLEMNQPEQALRDFREAVRYQASGALYLHLGAALSRLNRKQESHEAFARAQQIGLTIETLHPLERRRYREFLKQAAL